MQKYVNLIIRLWVSCTFCAKGQMVHSVRQRCGRRLALECPVDVDLVSCVPESACPAAMEYASTVCIIHISYFSALDRAYI